MKGTASLHRERMIARMLSSQYRNDSILRWVTFPNDTKHLIDDNGIIYGGELSGQNISKIDSSIKVKTPRIRRKKDRDLLSKAQLNFLYSNLMSNSMKYKRYPSGYYIVPIYRINDKDTPVIVIAGPDNEIPEIRKVFVFKSEEEMTDYANYLEDSL